MISDHINQELLTLKEKKNYRSLPPLIHDGRNVILNGQRMVNLSSNDYLGLANNISLRKEFLKTITPETFLPTSSSSRLLTGNFTDYQELEQQLAAMFGTESALIFNSGYHANTGIIPAGSNAQTLILADKLVHASLIDGIRLSSAKCIRYRHNDLSQLQRLISENHNAYEQIIIVTESIFSMDGDEADLHALVQLKKSYSNILLYVDEAHAFGVRGDNGLGCAEEQNCINDIDFLVGTFGKAIASAGAYIACRQVIREYLINKMRTFIFTTALPPINIQWTSWILEQLPSLQEKRTHLLRISNKLKTALVDKGYNCPSVSHIVPMIVGASENTICKAEEIQRKGFYALPVRPPTVPEGTSRIRPTDKDWLICYDYRSLEFDAIILQEYSEITLIAWSMGVWAASQIMKQYPSLPLSQSIAINGTPYPIHETKGITPAIFEGTLQGLNEQSLQKFQRRMCGSTAGYKTFQTVAPQRSIEELKEELAAIQKQYLSLPPSDFAWQKAIIGKNDHIFLPDSQWLAWRNKVDSLEYTEAAHYQQELFDNVIMHIN